MKRLLFARKKMDKRGAIGIIIFFILLVVTLVLGFIASLVVAITGIAGDAIEPVFLGLGTLGNTNLSSSVGAVITPLNQVAQDLSWIVGFAYVCALIFSIVFIVVWSYNPNPIFLGLYVMLIIFVVLGAIVLSNAYESIYSGSDDIASRLHDQTIMSYMILYSPTIIALIAFITGIYVFALRRDSGGGYGV